MKKATLILPAKGVEGNVLDVPSMIVTTPQMTMSRPQVQVGARLLLALSLVACFMVAVVGNPGALTLDLIRVYVNHVWVILLATVLMVGLFSIFGTLFRKPLVWGFLYAFAWEGVVAKVPGRIQTWNICC